jgi:pyridoxamine 5'-phosphate oxidase
MNKDIQKLRHEYGQLPLNQSEINSNPFTQFRFWFDEAIKMELPDANAMTLATVSADNKPTARILLLKDFNENGFCFFTNYESRKGQNIEQNPYGALVFFWPELERQIRIEGKIIKLSAKASDQYFFERPVGSRMAASVSPQSKEIENRKSLLTMMDQFEKKHGAAFNRPEFWGGYQLQADLFEFWQGRKNRLNDRIEYILENKVWKMRRLAP